MKFIPFIFLAVVASSATAQSISVQDLLDAVVRPENPFLRNLEAEITRNDLEMKNNEIGRMPQLSLGLDLNQGQVSPSVGVKYRIFDGNYQFFKLTLSKLEQHQLEIQQNILKSLAAYSILEKIIYIKYLENTEKLLKELHGEIYPLASKIEDLDAALMDENQAQLMSAYFQNSMKLSEVRHQILILENEISQSVGKKVYTSDIESFLIKEIDISKFSSNEIEKIIDAIPEYKISEIAYEISKTNFNILEAIDKPTVDFTADVKLLDGKPIYRINIIPNINFTTSKFINFHLDGNSSPQNINMNARMTYPSAYSGAREQSQLDISLSKKNLLLVRETYKKMFMDINLRSETQKIEFQAAKFNDKRAAANLQDAVFQEKSDIEVAIMKSLRVHAEINLKMAIMSQDQMKINIHRLLGNRPSQIVEGKR